MRRIIKFTPLIVLLVAVFSSFNGFSQAKPKKPVVTKRESERKAMRSRDSLLHTLNKSDTSINSLLQRVEQYATSFNQISNNLADGLDTVDISQKLPPIVKRLNKISSVAKTHKSSSLRYLSVLRDNLDKIQDMLDGWQSDLQDVNTKLVENQRDLLKFTKDSVLKTVPSDSLVKRTFFAQLQSTRHLWRNLDSINRRALLKVNLLQDKIAVSYTQALDEDDQIDGKIKGFAMKAMSGETGYIWEDDPQYDDFKPALNGTIKLNELLFSYFIKNETATHLAGLVFLILIFGWIMFSRIKVLKTNENPEQVFTGANYIFKTPILSSLLVGITIVPYFYNHPPAVFLETFFLVSIILSLLLIHKDIPKVLYNFLVSIFVLAVAYSISNLFIEISNIDRYFILLLSILSIATGVAFYKKLKQAPDDHLPYTELVLKIFIAMQALSLLLNLTGRFSLAKIAGVTAVFNLWLLVILYIIVNVIVQALFLQFQIKRGPNHIMNWIDYNVVQKKLKNTLLIAASLLWLFFFAAKFKHR